MVRALLCLPTLGTGAAHVLSQAQLWYRMPCLGPLATAGEGQLLQFLIPGAVTSRSQLMGAGSGPPA